MIRQAHTYLVSAMSGATLIAIAIVVFVLLVSAQVFRDFPLAGLNGGDDGKAHVSDARAATAPAAVPAKANPAQQRSTGSRSAGKDGGATDPAASGDLASTATPAAPSESAGSEGDGPSAGNQGSAGSPASSPTASAPSSPSQGSASSGGGSSSGGSGAGGGSATTPSGKVTETVNNTVNQVDETVTGGTLGKAGVTEVTEGVVNGVVGPESTVGKVVDETVKTVGGLLGGKP
jgi:hypothetical protein